MVVSHLVDGLSKTARNNAVDTMKHAAHTIGPNSAFAANTDGRADNVCIDI